jgi:hypothetical protein
VDDELYFSSGAAGTRTEFQKIPGGGDSLRLRLSPSDASSTSGANKTLAPGNRSNTVVNGVCTQIDAIVGQQVQQQCRPNVTVKTFQGTLMTGVPINWAIGLGGGVVAPENRTDNSCGTFGSTVVSPTDASATSSVCWTLGATPGTNTVVATGAAGGDAPLGVVFDSYITFTATALQITPTAGATGGTYPYDGLGHPGTGTCSNNLTPAVTYTSNGVATGVPTNVGTYTLTVTCGAGNPLYVTVNAQAQIQITPAVTSTTVSCPASVVYTGSPLTPCTASVTGPGLSQALVPTYSNNVNVGTATASATYAGGGNYQGSNGSANFQISGAVTTASVTCPASVTYTGSPVTPCTGSVTGPGLSQALTPTYVNNIVGTATATVNYAGGGNYLPSTASKNFQIKYVQSGCFASPVYSVMPTTKSFQNKGSNVPIKCALLTASGAGVLNANGSLLVQDKGTDGLASPVTVFSLGNAFKVSGSGNYAYGLDTSPSGFVSGHYYYVTATWTDGSTTNGWFYIK